MELERPRPPIVSLSVSKLGSRPSCHLVIFAKCVTSRLDGFDPAIPFLAGLVPLLEMGLIEHFKLRIAGCFSPATEEARALRDRASKFANACLGTGEEAPRGTFSTS